MITKHISNSLMILIAYLLYSSNNLFKMIQIVYDIINLCVSKYVIKYTKCTYEKNVISENNVEYININN